jgi:hypothetical protein
MNALGTIAIVIMGVVGYLITAQAMSEYSTFRYPRIIAALVVILGCIGLRQSGDGLAAALLIPFAALIVAGGVVWAVSRLAGACRKREKSVKRERSISAESAEANVSHNPWRPEK